jgi:hypothetical protein
VEQTKKGGVMGDLKFPMGLPTRPEVEKLLVTFPPDQMVVGTEIDYEQIEAVLNVSRKTHRYGTVVSAWRRELYCAYNLLLEAISGKMFRVMSGSGRVSLSSTRLREASRRAVHIAATTPCLGLTAAELASKDHSVRVSSVMSAAYNAAKKELVFKVG